MNKVDIHKIFRVAGDKPNVICPPKQVFVQSDFEYLLIIGGDLVNDEKEYNRFWTLLKTIGEIEFYISENLGATITDRNTPLETTISINDDYKIFKEKVGEFEPPFGWTAYHFFVYGQNQNWGIYICEFPTINIIGCTKNLSNEFRQVFSIDGNGYATLREFIATEFRTRPDLLNEFLEQYRLNESD